ncbi:hypothetical protein HMPREF1982_00110 [Clostridiales bacterium oral taxon 876 str. F0540]|nr:hypothetical protein HMPREF1982_00110 [Clostridiales bacterium oral taxon 876 str. F0540]
MKKIVSLALTAAMLLGTATTAFAEGTDANAKTTLTPEQKEARQKFIPDYLELMTKLTDLRAQTKTAQDENNKIASQIKEKHKALTSQNNKDSVDKIKAVLAQDKDLTAQAKNLNTQRQDLKKKFQEAVKNKDAKAAEDLKNQILSLNSEIEKIRQQIKSNNDSIKLLKDQLKAYRDSLKTKKDQIKPLSDQAKSVLQKIKDEEKSKQALWQTFKTNIQAKDYTTAENTLKSIIDAKTQIFSDIKSRGEVLNKILAVLNS